MGVIYIYTQSKGKITYKVKAAKNKDSALEAKRMRVNIVFQL